MNETSLESTTSDKSSYVSTAQVSLALGVSVTTVKRWVDDGVLPAHRTAGGHRKLLLDDVYRLIREENFPQADLSRLLPKSVISDPTNYSKLKIQLCEAIDHFDVDRVSSIINGAYRSGVSIHQLADHVIGPTMHQVGTNWSTGKIDVMQEHRITQMIVSGIYNLDTSIRAQAEKDRPIAVGGAPEHDSYILSALLGKLTLIDCGWDAVNLGPHTPFSAFRTAIEELSPQLVWISVSYVVNPIQFVQEYRAFFQFAQSRDIAVALGGQALTDTIRAQLPYTTFGDGMTQLASFAKTLHRRPSRPKRGRPVGSTVQPSDKPPMLETAN